MCLCEIQIACHTSEWKFALTFVFRSVFVFLLCLSVFLYLSLFKCKSQIASHISVRIQVCLGAKLSA